MNISPDECAHVVLEVVPLVMRTIRADMRRHRAPELTVPQYRTLAFVNRNEGASLSDVAEHIGLTLPSTSKLMDGLVTRGLVTRETHAGDRRRITLALTPHGRMMLQSAHAAAQDCLARRLAGLSAAERAMVTQALRALRPIFMPDSPRAR
jgi:DNA-binding MarR family transcriptional regulator